MTAQPVDWPTDRWGWPLCGQRPAFAGFDPREKALGRPGRQLSRVTLAHMASRDALLRLVRMKHGCGGTAARGGFPYAHRTQAQVAADERAERRDARWSPYRMGRFWNEPAA